jgi:hypothetical protein
MKQLYTLTLLLLIAFTAKAQYTITGTSNPVIGDVEKTWSADTITPNGLYPLGGINQIWNFSGITISPTTAATSASYVAVSAAPNGSLFSAANLAKTSDNLNYEMSSETSASIINYGSTNNTLTILNQDPLLYANLPFTYGSLCNDTYSASYVANTIPVARTGTVSTSGDGTGTLNMPGNKNYSNVLRIKIDLKQVDNYGAAGSQTITMKAYMYLSSVSKFAILAVNVFTFTSVQGTTTATFYGKSVDVGDMIFAGIKENANTTNFSISPNPSVNKMVDVHFTPAQSENYELIVFNALGQQVKSIVLENFNEGKYDQKVDLSELKSGLYYIKLKGKIHETTQKLIID